MNDWLAEAFFGPIIEEGERRKKDPGYPAYPWLPDGRPTPPLVEGASPPVSFVVAAVSQKYPVLINLDQLRRSVLDALAGRPDTRTPSQRRSDDWAAYLRAKEKYLGTTQSKENGAGTAQEPAPGPAEEGAAAGTPGPVGAGGAPDGPPADVR